MTKPASCCELSVRKFINKEFPFDKKLEGISVPQNLPTKGESIELPSLI